MLICFLVFIAGFLTASMQSFNGLLQSYIGLFGTSLVVHAVGGLLLILHIVLVRREQIRLWPMPWYLYSSGLFGLVLVAGSSYCISGIGPALTACLGISGQLILSILMDHFGWMGVKRLPFSARRIPCLLFILAGLLAVSLSGQNTAAAQNTPKAPFILLALALGGITVYSKTVNFQATRHLGTSNGTLVNYVTASLLSALLLLLPQAGHAAITGFMKAPPWLYLGGVFGVIALVINVTSLKRINLFQSTAWLLIGQLTGSAALDAILYHTMSAVKLLGVAAVAAGVIWDKKKSL